MIILHITDPAERALPRLPAISMTDLETGTVSRLRRKDAALLVGRTQARQEELATTCRRAGADLVPLDTAEDYLPAIMRLFQRRMSRR